MNFEFKRVSATSFKCDLMLIPVAAASEGANKTKKKSKGKSAKGKRQKSQSPFASFATEASSLLTKLNSDFNSEIEREVELHQFKAKGSARLNIYGGKKAKVLRLSAVDGSLEGWRKLGGDFFQAASAQKAKSIALALSAAKDAVKPENVAALVEGFVLATYEFDAYKQAPKKKETVNQVTFLIDNKNSKDISAVAKRAEALAQATMLARDMVNTPPEDMQPKDLLSEARKIARAKNVSLKVFNRSALRKMGANALLSVAKGSDAEPFLIHLTLKSSRKRSAKRNVVLVGKGVTFDSGGLSIKSGKGMEEMKCDMAGAAAVLSAMQFLAKLPSSLAPTDTIHAIVPTVENMVNGESMKPGDVLRAINKKTIEVLNTDAEGRLILADAFGYAAKLKPDLLIDLATLTGACVVALGGDYAGLFANDEDLARKLKDSAERAGELLWELPLAKEYEKYIKSSVAEIKNTGTPGPGAITAALFLQHFVPDGVKWAHLDIAGPAFVTKSNEYIKPGGTGYGVRTIVEFLLAKGR